MSDRFHSLIQNAEELVQWFDAASKDKKVSSFGLSTGTPAVTKAQAGVYVHAAIRREFMTSEYQGRITIEGHVQMVKFLDLKDGVYKAQIG